MAIGSLDKAGRLEQLKTFARVQVWSGYKTADEVRADVLDAVLDEVKDPADASRLVDEYVALAERDRAEAATTWPSTTGFDHLQAAFTELRSAGMIVLEACEDHWAADAALERASSEGHPPTGIAYFTHADAWHAVEHGMLELNVWHANSANVAPGDELLEVVLRTLAHHGLDSLFDEGRIEISIAWQRRDGQNITHSNGRLSTS